MKVFAKKKHTHTHTVRREEEGKKNIERQQQKQWPRILHAQIKSTAETDYQSKSKVDGSHSAGSCSILSRYTLPKMK